MAGFFNLRRLFDQISRLQYKLHCTRDMHTDIAWWLCFVDRFNDFTNMTNLHRQCALGPWCLFWWRRCPLHGPQVVHAVEAVLTCHNPPYNPYNPHRDANPRTSCIIPGLATMLQTRLHMPGAAQDLGDAIHHHILQSYASVTVHPSSRQACHAPSGTPSPVCDTI